MDQIFQTSSPGFTAAVTSTASTAVALPLTSVLDSVKMGMVQIRVVNEGPNIAFIATGGSAVTATLPTSTATTTCDAVLAGGDAVFTLRPDATHFSAICRAAGTATLSVYIGKGE